MTSLLDRLSVRAKMLLIAAVALLMAAVPEGLLVLRNVEAWRHAQVELSGLPPATQMLQLIRVTQHHRGLSNGVLSGNEAGAADRETAARALLDSAARVDVAVAGLGDAALSTRLTEHRNALASLVDAVNRRDLKASESFARHTALVTAQTDLLYDVSVASGLVLQAEPAGYFLQDAALRQLPPVIEALARLRGSGMGLLARGEAGPNDRAQLQVLAAQARTQSAAAAKALRLAAAADADAVADLLQVLDTSMKTLEDGLAYADARLIKAEALDEAPAAWWARTTQVIDAQFALGDRTRAALERSMAAYVTRLQWRAAAELAALLALVGLAMGLIVAVGRRVSGAMQQAVVIAEAVAEGDLTRRVQARGSDECARMLRALDAMAQGLAGTVSSVRDNATQVATASSQIAQGNLDLSGRTEQQASALQQTAASVEELSSTVTQTADHARQASTLADTARSVAARGGDAVGEMVATMKEIDDSSRRIGEIIATIDGIAFQTNILALNAAVEAARAGEQGRGFAVVAGEVRSLAQRSAAAAKEIRTLIGASVERAEIGSAQADRAGHTMGEIVAAIDRVSTLMHEISTAAGQQSSGVAQVGQAMSEIDRATQQNAALVEESAAAADSLRRQAEALQQAVGAFRVAG